MKSKTAIAALAATLAMCLPAKAVIVDAAHPLEMYFNSADIPPGGHPIQLARITVTFGADLLNPGESLVEQIFDADHVPLWSYVIPISGSTYSSYVLGADFFPAPTDSPYLSAVFSAVGNSSFDIVGATANINDVDYIVVGSFNVPSVPGPIVGTGLPGLLGMLGFGGFWWRRRQKIA